MRVTRELKLIFLTICFTLGAVSLAAYLYLNKTYVEGYHYKVSSTPRHPTISTTTLSQATPSITTTTPTVSVIVSKSQSKALATTPTSVPTTNATTTASPTVDTHLLENQRNADEANISQDINSLKNAITQKMDSVLNTPPLPTNYATVANDMQAQLEVNFSYVETAGSSSTNQISLDATMDKLASDLSVWKSEYSAFTNEINTNLSTLTTCKDGFIAWDLEAKGCISHDRQ